FYTTNITTFCVLLNSLTHRSSRPLLLFCYFFADIIFFFFNDTPTTEIYTLSLHDALPISRYCARSSRSRPATCFMARTCAFPPRSEEHTSELQSRVDLVCRLLLEKKKIKLFLKGDNAFYAGIVRLRLV